MEEIIEDHAREHVANPALSEEERNRASKSFLKPFAVTPSERI
jgi:DNA-binding FrmR family transcriptional regulator